MRGGGAAGVVAQLRPAAAGEGEQLRPANEDTPAINADSVSDRALFTHQRDLGLRPSD